MRVRWPWGWGQPDVIRHSDILPLSCPPRGLKREQAAAYVGPVGTTKFDEMVKDGRMPKPKRIDGLTSWDRLELDVAYAALPTDDDSNPWDGRAG